MLRGMYVTLVPAGEADYELMARWLGPSLSGALGMGGQDLVSAGTMERYFGKETVRCAMVEENGNRRKIGFISWHTQRYEGSYEIGGVIGEPELWDLGYGAEAVLAVVHHLFHDKNAHRIQFITGLYNKRTVHMAVKLLAEKQVVLEGVLRDHYFIDGQYHDAIVMSLLRDEYYAEDRDFGEYENVIPESDKAEARREFWQYVTENWKDDIFQRLVR